MFIKVNKVVAIFQTNLARLLIGLDPYMVIIILLNGFLYKIIFINIGLAKLFRIEVQATLIII